MHKKENSEKQHMTERKIKKSIMSAKNKCNTKLTIWVNFPEKKEGMMAVRNIKE